jgi:hypothetical protein
MLLAAAPWTGLAKPGSSRMAPGVPTDGGPEVAAVLGELITVFGLRACRE